jgi:hypothetical protein
MTAGAAQARNEPMSRSASTSHEVAFALPEQASRPRTLHVAAMALIVVWAVFAWIYLRPAGVAVDWAGWRQADTQAIARHLAEPGANFLYPRVDWGGKGPGYVETELQLYAAITGLLLRWFGDAEWPGRLVSLLSSMAAAYALFRGLSSRLGAVPALAGLGIFLASPGLAFTATAVQPDVLALVGYIVAWYAFLDFTEKGDGRALVVYGVAGTLGMLVKPTMAQLGVSSFVLLLLASRERLKDRRLWLTWGLMLGTLGLYLWHAHGLYTTYGNTFGVFSPEYDTKSPKLEHLFMPHLYWEALRVTRRHAIGVIGTVAVALAFLKPRAHLVTWALLAGNVVWTILSLRYTSGDAGTHYALASTVLAADAGARALAQAAPRFRNYFAAFAALCIVWGATRSFSFRRWSPSADPSSLRITAAARELAKLAGPGTLVIVRTDHVKQDTFWRTQNNKNDPRVLYLTRTRGWGVHADEAETTELERQRREGARFYVSPFDIPEQPAVAAWLEQRGRVVATTEFGGRILALDTD